MHNHRYIPTFVTFAICLAGCAFMRDSIVMEGGRLYPKGPAFAIVPSPQEVNCKSKVDFDAIYVRSRVWKYEKTVYTNYLHVRFWPTGECTQIVNLRKDLNKVFCDSFKLDPEWSVGFYKVNGESIVFEVYAGGAYVRYFGTVDTNGIHVTRVDVKYQNANFTHSSEQDMYYHRHYIGKLSGKPDWTLTGVINETDDENARK